MEITEIRVFLKEGQDKKLRAYTTVTFNNAFVVRNIKVIQGANGLFIAMPSRKLKSPCPKCGFKNEKGSKFCNHCGQTLSYDRQPSVEEESGVQSDHRDIAHPITQQFREYLQNKVLEAYKAEVEKENAARVPTESVNSGSTVSK